MYQQYKCNSAYINVTVCIIAHVPGKRAGAFCAPHCRIGVLKRKIKLSTKQCCKTKLIEFSLNTLFLFMHSWGTDFTALGAFKLLHL